MADFMQGLMGLFTPQGDGLGELLNDEQRKKIANQAMMTTAMKLLASGGRSAQPISLGQALGGAYLTGQEAMNTGVTNAAQNLLLRQKLDEAKTSTERRKAWAAQFTGQQPATTGPMQTLVDSAAITPAAAAIDSIVPRPAAGPMSMPLPTGQMPGQQPAGRTIMGVQVNPAQEKILSGMTEEKGLEYLTKINDARNDWGDPKPIVRNGQIVMERRNKLGESQIMDGDQPYEALPTDIRAVEYLQGKPLAGSGPQGIQAVGQYREQIAPKTKIENKLPPIPTEFGKGAAGAAATRLDAAIASAEAANRTLQTADRLLPALDAAITGPAADARTTMLRVGQALGIAGKTAEETLAATRQVTQALAASELEAAANMKGQGAVTESERVILRRMSIGDPTMSAAEIKTGVAIAQRVARQRQKDYADLLQRAGRVQGFSDIAPMYEFTPYKSQIDVAPALKTPGSLSDALSRELERRKPGGQQ